MQDAERSRDGISIISRSALKQQTWSTPYMRTYIQNDHGSRDAGAELSHAMLCHAMPCTTISETGAPRCDLLGLEVVSEP